MLALIGNLSLGELLLIGVAAVLVFGKRLPEVAGQAMSHVARFRRSLDDLRRDTGIDREMRDMRRQFDDVTREATQIIESPSKMLAKTMQAPEPVTPSSATPEITDQQEDPEGPLPVDSPAADRPRSD